MLILLLQLKMRALRNIVSRLRGAELFALLIGIVALAYSILFAIAIAHATATLLLSRPDDALKPVVLSFYVVLFVLPIVLSSFFGGRFRAVIRLEQLASLPLSRRDTFLFFAVSEALDPFVVFSCALAGTVMVWLTKVSWVSIVPSATLLVLFAASIVLTKVVYQSALDFVCSHKPLLEFLWLIFTVICILLCIYAVRLALGAVASGQAPPETRVWWLRALPPGIVASAISSIRNGNIPLVHIVGLAAIVICGSYGCWHLHGAKVLRPARAFSFESALWVRKAEKRSLAVFCECLHPLAIKDILYYIRCNRSQLAFLAGIVIYVIMGLSSGTANHSSSEAWQLYALVIGAMTSVGIAGNTFAFEGSGITCYRMLPLSPATVLRTKLGSFRIVMGFEFGVICTIALLLSPFDIATLLPLFAVAVVILDLSLTAGLHLSCLFPMKVDFQGVFGQTIPTYSVFLWIVFTGLLVAPAFLFRDQWYLGDWRRVVIGLIVAAAGAWLFRRWMVKTATLQFIKNWERILFIIR